MFSLRHFLSTHCSCRGLLLHLTTLNEATHSVGLPWTRDRPVTPASSCAIHGIRKRQIFMRLARFEPSVPPSDRHQVYALDRLAKWIGLLSEPCHRDTQLVCLRLGNHVCQLEVMKCSWWKDRPSGDQTQSIALYTSQCSKLRCCCSLRNCVLDDFSFGMNKAVSR